MESTYEQKGREVCDRIIRFMSDNHISGKTLAAAMGVTPQSVSNMLRKGRLFSIGVAQKWVEGFGSLGCEVNIPFFLTGEGRITNDASLDPDLNVAYSRLRRPDGREEGQENDDSPEDQMILKFLRMRDERNYYKEKCLDLMVENQMLKEKLAAIGKILGKE